MHIENYVIHMPVTPGRIDMQRSTRPLPGLYIPIPYIQATSMSFYYYT